jgi:hypothetical protein
MLRVKYYDAVVAISKEIEIAKQYLGNAAKPTLETQQALQS